MKLIDNTPVGIILVLCILPGLAPFVPLPHLVEKIRMLGEGTLNKPIDIFDLLFHSAPFILLAIKLFRLKKRETLK